MAHKVDGSEINSMLNQTGFGDNVTTLKASDPIVITQIILKLEQIKPYDKNPRQAQNPKYQSIKDSVKQQRGLNNHFNVTRRPGDELYMIQSGGNTRYAVLRELYDESGDDVFNTVHCLFIPWKSEATVLSHHLIENLVRGEMLFIDQAYAVSVLKSEIEMGLNRTLSAREFEAQTKQLGFDISRRNASRMALAIELDQYIPHALRGGLSITAIDKLNALKTDCARVKDLSDSQVNALYANTLSALDDKDLSIDEVRHALCVAMAQSTNTTPEMIEVMMAQDAQSPVVANKPAVSIHEKQKTTPEITEISVETGYRLAHAIGKMGGFDNVIQPSDTMPGYQIEVGQAAPPMESPLLLFLQALINQKGVGVFGQIDLLQIDDQTLTHCYSLLRHCRH